MVRFKETFRERMPEWVQSVCMVLWGFTTIAAMGLFEANSFFAPLLLLMGQQAWGVFAIVVGTVRLSFLVINGAWRPSAHIRAIGCVFGCLLWGSLFVSALSLPWITPAVATYGTMLAFDLFSLWFAAGDAKLADLSARGEIIK